MRLFSWTSLARNLVRQTNAFHKAETTRYNIEKNGTKIQAQTSNATTCPMIVLYIESQRPSVAAK